MVGSPRRWEAAGGAKAGGPSWEGKVVADVKAVDDPLGRTSPELAPIARGDTENGDPSWPTDGRRVRPSDEDVEGRAIVQRRMEGVGYMREAGWCEDCDGEEGGRTGSCCRGDFRSDGSTPTGSRSGGGRREEIHPA